MVICLEQGADLHMAQLMPLPLTVSCFSKIQIGFAFRVPAHPGSPGQRAVKRVCVCVCVLCHYVSKTEQYFLFCECCDRYTSASWSRFCLSASRTIHFNTHTCMQIHPLKTQR